MRNSPILLVCFGVMASGPGCLGDKNLGELGDDTGTTAGAESDTRGSLTDSATSETTTRGETTDPTGGETTATTGGTETGGSSGGSSSGDTGSSDDTGSSGDTGGTGLRCETEPTPVLNPVLEVSVELINDTEQTFHFAGATDGCTPFGIRREGQLRPLEVGGQCGCECPPPSDVEIATVAIAPGQSYMVSWDGRVLATFDERTLCQEAPFPDECISEPSGSLQPIESGLVELLVPVFGPAAPLPGAGSYGLLDMCLGLAFFAVELDLGAEDVSVEVLLSTVVLR